MLSHVIARLYKLPIPEHIRDESLVGHTKTPPTYKNIPQIAITHSHPHYLMRLETIHKTLDLPKYAFVVRDIPDALVSLYEKWHTDFPNFYNIPKSDVSFTRYLHVGAEGSGMEDIWGLIMYFNAWGDAQKACPEHVLAMRYEDWRRSPHEQLSRLCSYIGIKDITEDIIEYAVESSSKEKMSKKLNLNEAHAAKTVNLKERKTEDWYSEEDMHYVFQVLKKHLKYDFGYGYL